MQHKDIITISVTDAVYPSIFMQLDRPPNTIYALGNLKLLKSQYIVAIVGTRRTTNYGREITLEISKSVAANGGVILSGLAYGIDSIAHRGALKVKGKTIAVVPSGLGNIYPVAHTKLAREILNNDGLLLSEIEFLESPKKYHFVERNRLIAALCKVLLVTEAAHKSGTFHTVKFAQKLNKTIAAVPGNINSPMSKGVNRLFFEGAQPILESADLLSLLGLNEEIIKPKYVAANQFERTIISLLEEKPLSSDTIIKYSEFEISSLNVHLTMLEIKGIIIRTGGLWRLAK
jgi:DNA processing protein